MSSQFRITDVRPLLHSYVFDVERRTIASPEGEFERDVVTHRGAVAILAVDNHQRVGVIKQYRSTIDKELWEIPAGTIDHHEIDPLAVAKRELLEELGCIAQEWTSLGVYLNSPGWTNQRMHIFRAHSLTLTDRTPLGPEEEHSEISWWTAADIRAAILEGVEMDATATIAFQRYLIDYVATF